MIQLGAYDDDVQLAARNGYLKELETITRVPFAADLDLAPDLEQGLLEAQRKAGALLPA